MNTLILSDNQAITRMGMKAIAITRFDKVLEADDIHVLTKKLLTEERLRLSTIRFSTALPNSCLW